VEDGRRTYDEVAGQGRAERAVGEAPRRPAAGPAARCRGFTAIVDPVAMGWGTEALVELFYAPGTTLDRVAASLQRHPEVVEAWSVTGEADCIARVRTVDNADLERLIMNLQRDGLVVRTRSQVVMSSLVTRPSAAVGPGV
jgi:DNA-binding Lrp family transcriptional regulator